MDNLIIKLIFFIPAILIALVVHEYAHGLVAYNLGDPTAKYSGRLTLNPLDHLDIWGTLMLFISFLSGTGFVFGWAKPVPYNPNNFRYFFRDTMFVGLAGPLSNFAMAAIAGLFFRFSFLVYDIPLFGVFMHIFIMMNLSLGLFNLIPIPPLDGSRILMGILPKNLAWKYSEMERNSPMIMFAILIILLLTNLLGIIMGPPFEFLYRLFTGR